LQRGARNRSENLPRANTAGASCYAERSGTVVNARLSLTISRPLMCLSDFRYRGQFLREFRNIYSRNLPDPLCKYLSVIVRQLVAKTNDPSPFDLRNIFLCLRRNPARRFTEYLQLSFSGKTAHPISLELLVRHLVNKSSNVLTTGKHIQ